MEFVELARLAAPGSHFQDIARMVLHLRYNRMIERFYPRAMDLRRKLNETSSVISGSLVLEYALYGLPWMCNDMDIFTREDCADEWEEFFTKVGYVRVRGDKAERKKEDGEEDDESDYNPNVKEIRTLTRKPRGTLVDIIISDTPNVLKPVVGFWNSCLQNFATFDTFTFAILETHSLRKGMSLECGDKITAFRTWWRSTLLEASRSPLLEGFHTICNDIPSYDDTLTITSLGH